MYAYTAVPAYPLWAGVPLRGQKPQNEVGEVLVKLSFMHASTYYYKKFYPLIFYRYNVSTKYTFKAGNKEFGHLI